MPNKKPVSIHQQNKPQIKLTSKIRELIACKKKIIGLSGVRKLRQRKIKNLKPLFNREETEGSHQQIAVYPIKIPNSCHLE